MQYNYEHPGICDFHVHVGEHIGNYTLAQSFKDVNAICQRQNIRAIGAFVTEEQDFCITDKFAAMQADAKRYFDRHVHWHLTPVYSDMKTVQKLLGTNTDLKFYTTYKDAGLYSSYEQLAEWMQAFPNTRMLVHCEDDEIVSEASLKHAFEHPFVHSLRRPESAEQRAVEKVLELAVKHQATVHIVHVSTPKAALLIRQAKSHNPRITCETAPHYLLYSSDLLLKENSHRLLCSPPYRSESTRGMLVELLQDHYFDIIASDHCPFLNADKDRYKDDLSKVPNGIPGLEHLYESMYRFLVQRAKISEAELNLLCCVNPAKLMNIWEES